MQFVLNRSERPADGSRPLTKVMEVFICGHSEASGAEPSCEKLLIGPSVMSCVHKDCDREPESPIDRNKRNAYLRLIFENSHSVNEAIITGGRCLAKGSS